MLGRRTENVRYGAGGGGVRGMATKVGYNDEEISRHALSASPPLTPVDKSSGESATSDFIPERAEKGINFLKRRKMPLPGLWHVSIYRPSEG